MGNVVRYEPCPKCRASGRDRRGDNLVRYKDGGAHCFANCGYHEWPKGSKPRVKENHGNEDKRLLPYDFSREVPATAWRWLLQFGLPYTYWKDQVGWSEHYSRLVFTTDFCSVGRFIGEEVRHSDVQSDGVSQKKDGPALRVLESRKWYIWGDSGSGAAVLGGGNSGPVVLVEDIVSAHKVAQVATCIPLFGTKVHNVVLRKLIALKRPVALWLDSDQYTLLAPKINRIQTFLTHSVRYIHTEKDPKKYSIDEIKEILK